MMDIAIFGTARNLSYIAKNFSHHLLFLFGLIPVPPPRFDFFKIVVFLLY